MRNKNAENTNPWTIFLETSKFKIRVAFQGMSKLSLMIYFPFYQINNGKHISGSESLDTKQLLQPGYKVVTIMVFLLFRML